MNRNLENAQLVTDLDFKDKNLLHSGHWTPAPGNLVGEDDSRLSDARPVKDGTVSNESVAVDAAIDQGKFHFIPNPPSSSIGTSPEQAADGGAVQQSIAKGSVDGYAELDVNAQLPSAQVAATTTGTLKVLELVFPPELGLGPGR